MNDLMERVKIALAIQLRDELNIVRSDFKSWHDQTREFYYGMLHDALWFTPVEEISNESWLTFLDWVDYPPENITDITVKELRASLNKLGFNWFPEVN